MFRCVKQYLEGQLLVFLLIPHFFYNVVVYNDFLHCKLHNIEYIVHSMKQISVENNIVIKCDFEQK